ncbi:hypothetical protein RvVAR0630_34200 [Agrobacterium vitis]|nr:hypothetical protein RvVAR0630_34200 [Agrobacterium vitis]
MWGAGIRGFSNFQSAEFNENADALFDRDRSVSPTFTSAPNGVNVDPVKPITAPLAPAKAAKTVSLPADKAGKRVVASKPRTTWDDISDTISF